MKSKAFIFFAVLLLISCAVAKETTSKEEGKVNSNPKAEEVASEEANNGEFITFFSLFRL